MYRKKKGKKSSAFVWSFSFSLREVTESQNLKYYIFGLIRVHCNITSYRPFMVIIKLTALRNMALQFPWLCALNFLVILFCQLFIVCIRQAVSSFTYSCLWQTLKQPLPSFAFPSHDFFFSGVKQINK